MRFVLEFHDSEVRDVVTDGDAVHVRFAAASVRDEQGRRGWLASVQLTLTEATLSGDARHAFGKVVEGRLDRDGQPVEPLALPATLGGDLALALRLANGTALALRGRTLAATVADDARFAEDLSC
jgi:hypothetical protein